MIENMKNNTGLVLTHNLIKANIHNSIKQEITKKSGNVKMIR